MWCQNGITRGLVEHLKSLVHNLDVLRRADCAVGIGRRAVATDAGERYAVEVEDGGGQGWREQVERGDVTSLDDRVRRVVMSIWHFRVLVRLVLGFQVGRIPRRHTAYRRRDVVFIRSANGRTAGLLAYVWRLCRQRPA